MPKNYSAVDIKPLNIAQRPSFTEYEVVYTETRIYKPGLLMGLGVLTYPTAGTITATRL